MAKNIDGKKIAEETKLEIAKLVSKRKSDGLPPPGLATVLVGEDPASDVYVRMKQRACEEAGITAFDYRLPEDTNQTDLESLIDELNERKDVHGILVQLPLPKGLDEERVLKRVSLEKDVDGFHPENVGKLAQKGRTPLFVPATPSGVMVLLEHAGAELSGADAVVLGRSNIVGMPVALLLIERNATVTVCHSRTNDLAAKCREADVLIAAVGRPEMVRSDWVKPGAIVIDVGVNRVEDSTKKRGYRLVGDVAFDEVKEIAGAITPVPGGVGPMTIAMLLKNTVRAAELSDN
ncbi:MAG: bifunctional methylenetetrahydrofolate dehydrogenase/methenyltetrahydrofolate cyclohydrolase FolD [Anaerolineae bacterium]|nr:bifunctional methylenetetrahydrofolate dehydrogenase/methenyltetrahydrofolate cyclohydrolase FolD [Anaerolineae bacterium]